MDVFGTAVTVVQQIYTITVFVRGVVSEIKSYDSQTLEIQAKLEHEFLFLEEFKDIMFDREDAAVSYNALPNVHKKDIQNILGALDRLLSQYGLLAVKHGLHVEDNEFTVSSMNDSIKIQDIRSKSSTWRSKFGQFRAKFTKLDWALFDKDKVLKLLQEYSEWTGRLRQVTYMILLVAGTLGSASRSDLAGSKQGQSLRLDAIAKRQMKAETLLDIEPLDQDLLSGIRDSPEQRLYQLAEYQDPSGFDTVPVLLERHFLNGNLAARGDSDSAQKDQILEPVRSLTALLHGTALEDSSAGDDQLRSLDCIGYLDQGYPEYALMVYRYPTVATTQPVKSLYGWISHFETDPSSKPSIGERFFVAHSLASSMFNVHASGWVHKGVRSRGILLLSEERQSGFVPYLIGWGTARRVADAKATNMHNEELEHNDLEANLYRHPERYDMPSKSFTPAHDLYALGVVLLEIGHWKTMAARFKKPISIAREKYQLPAAALVREHLLRASRSAELKQETGVEYARAVERCLLTDFDVKDDDEKHTVLIRNFRELVIDKLQLGLLL